MSRRDGGIRMNKQELISKINEIERQKKYTRNSVTQITFNIDGIKYDLRGNISDKLESFEDSTYFEDIDIYFVQIPITEVIQ